jgi:hypothetical protein
VACFKVLFQHLPEVIRIDVSQDNQFLATYTCTSLFQYSITSNNPPYLHRILLMNATFLKESSDFQLMNSIHIYVYKINSYLYSLL